MSFLNCCVPDCSTKVTDGIPLHRFPNPATNMERFRAWVANVGGEIRTLSDNYIFKNRRVCHKHFHAKWYYIKNRLCPLAIPVLHLSAGLPTFQHLEELNSSTSSLVVENVSVSMESLGTEQIPSTSSIPPRTRTQQTQSKKMKMIKTDLKVRKVMKMLRSKILKRDKTINSYKKRLQIANDAIKSHDFLQMHKLSKSALTFMRMQLSQSEKKNHGRRFNTDEKILALSLYKTSPKAYRVLSEICILPKRCTLQLLLQKVKIFPGINKRMFDNLKLRVQKMPEKFKYCCIVFDEMAIAPHFDISEQNVLGFVDDGEKRQPLIADHALVFMVRGVIKKYKQPVQYSYCAGTTKSNDMKHLLINVIKNVQATGLKVVAITCDQGATNMAAINSLLKDTKEIYVKKGREYPGGFVLIGGSKIFPLYDPPHLIKGIRNNLLTKNLSYKKDNKIGLAKWQHLIELVRKSPGYRGVRLVPKLTEKHVMPHLIPKMRVKHCTQVFSRTVYAALGFMAEAGKLPEEAKDTAEVLLFFDSLFDSLNGSYSKVKSGKIYRTAVTSTSPHHQLWRKSLPVLKTMTYVDKNGKNSVVPTISSWIKTIEGFKMLCLHLHKLGIKSILPRNFNQDPLENFFGAIRAHGYSNIMPTALAFQAAYKTLLVNNMVSSHSVGANCEKDKSKCLQNLRYYLEEDISAGNIQSEYTINENHLNIIHNNNELLNSNLPQSIERCAAIGYCSGWLVNNAKKYVYKSCSVCSSQLETTEKELFHNFIKISEYTNKNWLCYPSRNIFDAFAHIEVITMEIMKFESHKQNVIEYIKLIIATIVNFGFLTCNEHRIKLIEYLIKKNVYFCVNNWCKEINNIMSGKSTNCDESDPIKIMAQNYYTKNKLRKKKRGTHV